MFFFHSAKADSSSICRFGARGIVTLSPFLDSRPRECFCSGQRASVCPSLLHEGHTSTPVKETLCFLRRPISILPALVSMGTPGTASNAACCCCTNGACAPFEGHACCCLTSVSGTAVACASAI